MMTIITSTLLAACSHLKLAVQDKLQGFDGSGVEREGRTKGKVPAR